MISLNLYSKKKVEQILSDNYDLIENICSSYHLPSAYLKAILLMELPTINLLDMTADAVVGLNWLRNSVSHCFTMDRHTRDPFQKFDSSTGYGQIFSQVAIEAILFARDQHIPLFLGTKDELYPLNPEDLEQVWKRLRRDKVFNLSCAALNIIHAAYQMTGRIDFESYDETEKKMIFTRYNGTAKPISEYGEQAYRYYLELQA